MDKELGDKELRLPVMVIKNRQGLGNLHAFMLSRLSALIFAHDENEKRTVKTGGA